MKKFLLLVLLAVAVMAVMQSRTTPRRPSSRPTSRPSRRPSTRPSRRPTSRPSRRPTSSPSRRPSTRPSRRPTTSPSRRPTTSPSRRPTGRSSTRSPTGRSSTRAPTGRSSTRSPTGRASTRPATTSRPTQTPGRVNSSPAAQADKIIQYEGRFDKNGNLKVYNLPSGDGGGKYEVAGINDRYHPQQAAALKSMIEKGQYQEARAYAANYLSKYTDGTASKSKIPAIQFYLRDSSFNRGPGGAAKILQHALGVPTNGKVNDATIAKLREAEKNPQQLLSNLRASREWYERTYAHRSEGNKFWNGLVNRWNNAERDAKAFGFTPQE